MNENSKNIIVEKMNGGMLAEVKNLISRHLGIEVDLEVEVTSNWSGWSVRLIEVGDASTKVVTSTPLLAQLFKQSKLEIQVGYKEECTDAWFRVMIYYDHNFGHGSNGHDLMTFCMDINTCDVTDIKK